MLLPRAVLPVLLLFAPGADARKTRKSSAKSHATQFFAAHGDFTNDLFELLANHSDPSGISDNTGGTALSLEIADFGARVWHPPLSTFESMSDTRGRNVISPRFFSFISRIPTCIGTEHVSA